MRLLFHGGDRMSDDNAGTKDGVPYVGGMRFDPNVCPTCGGRARGTMETLPGLAEFDVNDDGSYEYGGYTEVFWDGQVTDKDDEGRVTLICGTDDAHEWQAERVMGKAREDPYPEARYAARFDEGRADESNTDSALVE